MSSTSFNRFRADLSAAAAAWSKDNATRLSSSLAYYSLLSVAPLLLLAVSIAGWFLGEATARSYVAGVLSARIGEEAKDAVDAFLYFASDPSDSLVGMAGGLLVLVYGASAAFSELQFAMNKIWEVTSRPGRGVRGMLRDRFVCFAMVGGVAVLLLTLLAVGAVLTLLGKHLGELPGGLALWQIVDFVLSVVAVAVLFALSYKVVPDVVIPVREVLPGALVSATLFALGELALGIYLEVWAAPRPQGAAGSIVVLLIWLYYSSQILLFGAELTKVRVAARGITVQPRRHAVRIRTAPDDPTLWRPTVRPREHL